MDKIATAQGETPVQRVIRLFGVKRLAATCDLTTTAIHKWGRDIPAKHQAAVLRLSIDQDVALSPLDVISGLDAGVRAALSARLVAECAA